MARRKKSTVSSAEFFKVFLSSNKLIMPPDFVKDFKRTYREKVVLKDVYGKHWHVSVKETPDGVFLEKGWESFVENHNITFGEFLVFRYDRAYSFMVKIFGTSGCKKSKDSDSVVVKIEDKSEDKMEEEPSSHTCPQGVELLFPDTQHSERFEQVKESEEQHAEGVVSEGPSFISGPKPKSRSKQSKLRIPDELISEHNLKLEKEMILRNENGEEWPVNIFRVVGNNDARLLGKGLHAFLNDNNVGLNDRCKFTFDNKLPICKSIHVQILRSEQDPSLKRPRGRPRKNEVTWVEERANSSKEKVSYSDDLPEFFKIYVPDIYSETMKIPPDFMDEFGEKIPTSVALENSCGLPWEVDMKKVDDDWFFQKGWSEFVEENSLEDRDFLTFAYDRKYSTFIVKVYGSNGCLKMGEEIDDDETSEDEEYEQESPPPKKRRKSSRRGIERISVNGYPSFELRITSSYLLNSFLTVPMHFWRRHLGERSGEATVYINNTRWEGITLADRGDRINLRGVTKFLEMNSLKTGTLCTFELIDSNNLVFNVTVAS